MDSVNKKDAILFTGRSSPFPGPFDSVTHPRPKAGWKSLWGGCGVSVVMVWIHGEEIGCLINLFPALLLLCIGRILYFLRLLSKWLPHLFWKVLFIHQKMYGCTYVWPIIYLSIYLSIYPSLFITPLSIPIVHSQWISQFSLAVFYLSIYPSIIFSENLQFLLRFHSLFTHLSIYLSIYLSWQFTFF